MVGKRRYLHARADTCTVDTHYDPGIEVRDRSSDVTMEPDYVRGGRIVRGPKFIEVSTGTEARALTVNEHLGDRRIPLGDRQGLENFVTHSGIKRIATMRPGEREHEAAPIPLHSHPGIHIVGVRWSNAVRRTPPEKLRTGLQRRVDRGFSDDTFDETTARLAAQKKCKRNRRPRELPVGVNDVRERLVSIIDYDVGEFAPLWIARADHDDDERNRDCLAQCSGRRDRARLFNARTIDSRPIDTGHDQPTGGAGECFGGTTPHEACEQVGGADFVDTDPVVDVVTLPCLLR